MRISIIICSRNKCLPHNVRNNIHATVGVEYELIVIDNSLRNKTIFQAYNDGVSKSSGDILVFMHDDVIFRSNNWGGVCMEHFQKDEKLGVIGIYGGHYLSKYVSHVGDSGFDSKNYYQWINGNLHHYFSCSSVFDKNGEIECVAVDGIFIAMRREVAKLVAFDETYKGFHLYDMDICMQTWNVGYEVKVVNDIIIEHKNTPNINKTFLDNNWLFYKKWEKNIPMIKGIEVSSDMLDLADELCRYKNYSRELQVEIATIKKQKWYKLGEYLKQTKKKCLRIIR